MVEMHIARVFTNTGGNNGEVHGVVIDESGKLDTEIRRKHAWRNGYSETVFVNNLADGNVSFYSTKREVPFAGSAAIAASFVIENLTGRSVSTLVCPGGRVRAWKDGYLHWIRAPLDQAPPWNLLQMATAYDVDRFDAGQAAALEHTLVWSWLDEKMSQIRARTFAPDWDIPEVEANGSGSMLLAVELGRQIDIRHGVGSVILAKPEEGNFASVGGRVVHA